MKTILTYIKNHLTGFLIGAISVSTIAVYADSGTIGDLFELKSGIENGTSVTNVYRLDGINIKDGTITNSEISSSAGISVGKISGLGTLAIKDKITESDLSGSISGSYINPDFGDKTIITTSALNASSINANTGSFTSLVINGGSPIFPMPGFSTANYIPKFDTVLGFIRNSIISESNGTISILGNLTLTNDGVITGNGSGITNINASNLVGSLTSSVITSSLSSWTGSKYITTLGTISSGTWNGDSIADNKIASALTEKSYNGVYLSTGSGADKFLNGIGSYVAEADPVWTSVKTSYYTKTEVDLKNYLTSSALNGYLTGSSVSGTAGKIPVFKGTNQIGDSSISEDTNTNKIIISKDLDMSSNKIINVTCIGNC